MGDDSDSERPSKTSLSGAYPEERDPVRRALTKQARAQENNVRTFESHWSAIKAARRETKEGLARIETSAKAELVRIEAESDERHKGLERDIETLSTSIHELTLKVVELRTKMALFLSLAATAGAVIGGVLTALITRFLLK